MYHHIAGDLVTLSPTRAVVEAGGVGFELSIPFSTFQALQKLEGSGERRVRLLAHLLVREDAQRLFGFFSAAERDAFRALIAVNGVGPAIALTLLSSLRVEELVRTIEAEDTRALQRVRGIGRKLAGRLVVELKDRLAALRAGAAPSDGGASAGASRLPAGAAASAAAKDPQAEAVLALVELGYSRHEGEERVSQALKQLQRGAGGASPSVEALLQEALRL